MKDENAFKCMQRLDFHTLMYAHVELNWKKFFNIVKFYSQWNKEMRNERSWMEVIKNLIIAFIFAREIIERIYEVE